jgi:hypothetical protein
MNNANVTIIIYQVTQSLHGTRWVYLLFKINDNMAKPTEFEKRAKGTSTKDTFAVAFQSPFPIDTTKEPKTPVWNEMLAFTYHCSMYAYLQAIREDCVGSANDFREDCVGSSNDLTFEASNGIGERLHHYSMEYSLQGKRVKVSTTAVYKRYIINLSDMSNYATLWV